MVLYSELPLNDKMAEKLGVHVLAEGIECREELEFIMTTDADYLQGYYLGRPE